MKRQAHEVMQFLISFSHKIVFLEIVRVCIKIAFSLIFWCRKYTIENIRQDNLFFLFLAKKISCFLVCWKDTNRRYFRVSKRWKIWFFVQWYQDFFLCSIVKNLQKNLDIIWQPPISKPTSPPFLAKFFRSPIAIDFESVQPLLPFMKVRGIVWTI